MGEKSKECLIVSVVGLLCQRSTTARDGTHVDLIMNNLINFAKGNMDPKDRFSIDDYHLFINLIMKEKINFESKVRDHFVTSFECGSTINSSKLLDNLILLSRDISFLLNNKQVPKVALL